MFGDDASNERFEEMARLIAREVSQSLDRAAEVDLDQIAGAIGVDRVRAKEWVDGAVGWLRSQAEGLDPDVAVGEHRPDAEATPANRVRSAGPHPLDLPTEDQGVALAALDSGRWTVEPGSHALNAHGEGPEPADALGLVGELRARDWIASNGDLTLAGRHALSRWLDAASPQ
jgi:hypothetical protein